jgi:hypothetical protein
MEKEKMFVLFTTMHGQDLEFVGIYRNLDNVEKELQSLREINKGSKVFGCGWEEVEVQD